LIVLVPFAHTLTQPIVGPIMWQGSWCMRSHANSPTIIVDAPSQAGLYCVCTVISIDSLAHINVPLYQENLCDKKSELKKPSFLFFGSQKMILALISIHAD
jgi:hypothetical protein